MQTAYIVNSKSEHKVSSLIAKVNVLPIHQREFLQTALQIIKEGRKQNGNQSFNLQKDMEQELLYIFNSVWESKKYMDHYINSQSFGTLMGAVNILSNDFQISIYSRSHHESEAYIKALRNK